MTLALMAYEANVINLEEWVGEEWIEKGIQCFCSEYLAKNEKHG